MKGAILYMLFACALLIGARQSVLASNHADKTTHCLVSKQLNDDAQVIDAEDRDDENFLTRKVTSASKWLSTFNCDFVLTRTFFSSISFSPRLHSYSGGDICIIQRVLRI